jgi:molybdopterin molybdotransferase
MVLLLSGGTELEPALYKVTAQFSMKKKAGRREWVRVRVVDDGAGSPSAQKFPRDGAGIISSMVDADGLIELSEDVTGVAPGDILDFLPFSEVSR